MAVTAQTFLREGPLQLLAFVVASATRRNFCGDRVGVWVMGGAGWSGLLGFRTEGLEWSRRNV